MTLFLNYSSLSGFTVNTFRKGTICLDLQDFQEEVSDGNSACLELDMVNGEEAKEPLASFLQRLKMES